ncbi:MAG: hypothetical protein OXB86_04690 [Bdellovibrionales bacterium]|nr:hypothetical protein [Bdellovibrionales bacterium]
MKISQIIGFFFSLLFFGGALISCGGSQITASEVNDDSSLEDFVRAARDHLETNYEQAVVDFGKDKRWRSESVYLYSLSRDGSFLLVHDDLRELKC